MLTKQKYSAKELFSWTKREILIFTLMSTAIVILYDVFDFKFVEVPWTPVGLVGTAVAFIVGFQNNAAYERVWEARKIWGGVVNTSRTWGMKIFAMVNNEHSIDIVSKEEIFQIKKELIYRHIAWLTAMRYSMREKRSWELNSPKHNKKTWVKELDVPEHKMSLEEAISPYISPEEWQEISNKKNPAAALLFNQSKSLKNLREIGLLWGFSFLNLEDVLEELFALQGKSERIKNFPYPRQYASLSYSFVWIFLILLPFGIVPEFGYMSKELLIDFPVLGDYFIWLSIPFCVIVSWVFHSIKRISVVSESPFQGLGNDVPISTISRTIEIDLRQLLGEDSTEIPAPFSEKANIQM